MSEEKYNPAEKFGGPAYEHSAELSKMIQNGTLEVDQGGMKLPKELVINTSGSGSSQLTKTIEFNTPKFNRLALVASPAGRTQFKKLICALVHSEDMLWSKEELCEEFGVNGADYDLCRKDADRLKQLVLDDEITHDQVYEWAKT